ncbi:MAG: aldo/keto reductase family protein [Planctomycetota bacterium]|jgi:voltage-dependent potassium channel beta subunit
MEYRQLGRSGLRVSEVVLGSWLTFGSSVDAEGTAACVRAALDEGIQTFDTADVYARGEAERVLGAALAGVRRSDIVLASKCFWPMSDGPNDRGLSRKHVMESAAASLRRLGTDYLDLYQCHRFDPEVPLEETVRAMEDLVRQGKVLHWGVSVWTGAQVEEALRLAREAGGYGPVSNQPPYSLLERGIETEVVPTCDRLGVGQIVFSPLAQGVLTGKYADGSRPAGSRGADEARNQFMEPFLSAENRERVRAFAQLARDAGTTPAALALAWCLNRPGVDAVIVGATRPEQVRENVRAIQVDVTEALAVELDRLFPRPVV